MKLVLVKYRCASCARTFDAPSLGENAYGEFLLWSKSGHMAYLNAFNDPTYKEVDALLAEYSETARLSAIERAKVLRHIYGAVACDADEDGVPFEIDSFPPCPTCGSQKMAAWQFQDAPEGLEVAVPPVTHSQWSGLTVLGKRERLGTELHCERS